MPCNPPLASPARLRHRAGFTLIEVLLALAIFAIGFAMIATVPAGATLMEKRFEQLVEAELAAHNTMEIVRSRKAFWPAAEFAYAGQKVAIDGAYSAKMGTSSLPRNAFRTEDVVARYGTECSAGGLLTPLISYPETKTLGPESRSADADAMGDFEDLLCNMGSSVGNESSAGDGGWGMLGNNIDDESPVFRRMFDTNNSGLGLGTLYGKASDFYGWWWSEQYYFSDANDRTNFVKGRIHCCHNRLTHPHVYPMEVRSYPSSVPMDRRRVFVQLAYADRNLNANRRQWVMYAAAMRKPDADSRWPEANDSQKNQRGYQFTMPQPPTRGDLSVYTTPAGAAPQTGGPIAMAGNIWGLFDSRAPAYAFVNPPQSDPDIGAAGDSNVSHRFIHLHPNLTDYCLWRQYGRVAPLSGDGNETVAYPSLMSLPAIVYDWDRSLIQVAYPKEYLPVGGQPDRRLKIGDNFLTAQGGFLLSVKSVRDESRAQYAVADRPFFQIVEVSPPLSETPLGGPAATGAADVGVGNAGHGGNAYPYWRLAQIYFAPPPAGKGQSSWTATHQIGDGSIMTNNPNQ